MDKFGYTDSRTWNAGRFLVRILARDITHLPSRVGAIVSSDDNYLTAGGGVSKAIVRAAGGSRVREEMQALVWGPGGRQPSARSALKGGQVVQTNAGHLQADYIFHAIVIDHDRYQYPNTQLVASVTAEALKLADTLHLTSIAFPLLGTGTGGLSTADAIEGMVDAFTSNGGLEAKPARIEVWIATTDESTYHGLTTDFQRLATRAQGSEAFTLWSQANEPTGPWPGFQLSVTATPSLPPVELTKVLPLVVQLQRLLSKRLQSNTRVIAQIMESRGYVGSFDDQLLEYCLDVEPPLLLTELLGTPDLIAWGQELGIPNDKLMGATPRHLANSLLSRIGFPLPPDPLGIASLIEQGKSALGDLRLPGGRDITGPSGIIRRCCQTALLDLLRFHGTVLLPAPFEASMKERKWLTPRKSLRELTAGSLLGVLRNLVTGMDGSTEQLAWLGHLERFSRRSFFDEVSAPQIEQAIGALSRPLHRDPTTETRAAVIEAGEVIVRFLRYRQATGLYPPVVSVTSWMDDAYGRRLIRAVDDAGGSHTIFTMEQLDPGHLYFMHPTTNPTRVNPLLVRLS